MGFAVTDYGVFTTPELHYVVRCLNTLNTPASYGFPSEDAYVLKLAKAYRKLVGNGTKSTGELVVDCANGVGTTAMRRVAPLLENQISVRLEKQDIENFEVLNNKVRKSSIRALAWNVLDH